jgi:hypothetical protein
MDRISYRGNMSANRPNLVNPYLKMGRAKVHLDALKEGILEFSNSEPYRIFPQDDLERGQHVITIRLSDPPLPLALISGDFICCLRSSLDYLAWQLAAISIANPSKDICFPIWGEDCNSAQRHIKKSTEGIPPEAITFMKSFQPYNHGNAYRDTHMWRLNALWSVEKHRHITLHSVDCEILFPGIPPRMPFVREELNDGCIMRFPLAAKQYMHLKPRSSVGLTFGDVDEGIELNFQELVDMYQFVSEKVIPRFARFFT